jgi:hypothetical protein
MNTIDSLEKDQDIDATQLIVMIRACIPKDEPELAAHVKI